jgi:hypothetical protein
LSLQEFFVAISTSADAFAIGSIKTTSLSKSLLQRLERLTALLRLLRIPRERREKRKKERAFSFVSAAGLSPLSNNTHHQA